MNKGCENELGHQQLSPHQQSSQMDHFMVYGVLKPEDRAGKGWEQPILILLIIVQNMLSSASNGLREKKALFLLCPA